MAVLDGGNSQQFSTTRSLVSLLVHGTCQQVVLQYIYILFLHNKVEIFESETKLRYF